MTTEIDKRPACANCGRHSLTYRVDGTYKCRLCPFDSRPAKKSSK